MAEVYIRSRIVWNKKETIRRAEHAADLLGLKIRKRDADGFVAGSQWWDSYELSVHVRTKFFTHISVNARSPKIFYTHTLAEKAAVFINLIHRPDNRIAPTSSVAIETFSPKHERPDWEAYEPTGDERILTQTLPMQASKARAALASLQRQAQLMGVDLTSGTWGALSEITDEALQRAPESLPVHVRTPKDIEDWLGYLSRHWRNVPAMRESLSQAMNNNRQRNGKWFQENGYGGN